jgi:carbon monoxide dehydrogenase subunit G
LDEQGRLRGFSFDTIAGGRKFVGKATPRQREESRVMSWQIENSELRGSITVELSPQGSETNVSATLKVESVGLISGMFFPVITAAIGNGFPASVDGFAARLS